MTSGKNPAQDPSGNKNRRQAERVAYSGAFKMAPYDGWNMPPPTAFVPVEARDLSPLGISFLAPARPEGEQLVLMLQGPSQSPIYVTARVAHCDEGFWDRKRQFLIGCEFTGRMRT